MVMQKSFTAPLAPSIVAASYSSGGTFLSADSQRIMLPPTPKMFMKIKEAIADFSDSKN